MAEEDDTALVVACVSIVIASVGAATTIISSSEQKRKRKHKVWVRQYIKQREQFGTYYKLLPELTDSAKFLHYLRMDVHTFDDLFTLVEPHISRKKTWMR